jgi:hypothetical protein
LALSFLVFEVLLRAFGGKQTAALWVATVLGLAALLFFRVESNRGKLTKRAYALLGGAIPMVLGMAALYVYVVLQ